MADTTRDIELRLRARDLSTADLKQVVSSVNELSSALDKQLAAASRLEVKEKELRATLQQLDQAAKNVAGLDATIQRYKLLSDQIERNQADLGKAADALRRHREAMEAGSATGKSADAALSGFERAVRRAQQALDTNKATLDRYDASLKQAGVDTKNLVSAEQQLVTTATQIGDARTKLNTTISNYAKFEREAREAAKATAAAQAAAAEAAKKEAAAVAEVNARRKEEAVQLRSMLSDRMRANREQVAQLIAFNEETKRLARQRHENETRQARQTVDEIRNVQRRAAAEAAAQPVSTMRPGATAPGGGILGTGPARGAGAPIGFLGLRPYELTNLGYQINDVVSGLVSGQNATQILAQQGGQFIQIFGRAALRWFPLVAVAIGGVAIAAQTLTQRLQTLSSNREFTAFLTTNKFAAEQNAQSLTLLRRELRDLGVGWEEAGRAIRIGFEGNIRSDRMRDVLMLARDMARVNGTEVPEAMKDLVAGISGGAEAFDELLKKYPAINQENARYIRGLFLSGQEGKAQIEIIRLLGEEYRKAADEKMSPFDKSVEKLRTSWNRLLDRLGDSKAFDSLIDKSVQLIDWLGKMVVQVDTLSERFQKFSEQAVFNPLVRGLNPDGSMPLTPFGFAWNMMNNPAAAPSGGPGRFTTGNLPVNTEELRKLVDILSEATRGLPAGYRVEAISTHRPGARVRGTGEVSEHAPGRAIDVRIVDANGQPVPGSMGAGGPLYDMLDKAVAAIAASRGIPIAVGSTFTRKDAGHYSIGGREAAITSGRITPDGSASSVIAGPTATSTAAAAQAAQLAEQQLATARASSREEQERLKREEIRLRLAREGVHESQRQAVIDKEIAVFNEQKDREEYQRLLDRNRQREEDRRNAIDTNAVEVAGQRAVDEAWKAGRRSYDELLEIRKRAEAEARQDIQNRRQDLDAIAALEKRIDDMRRQSLSQQKSAIDQLNEATNLKYDNEIKNIEKVAERRGNVDKAALDAMKQQVEQLRQQELSENNLKAARQAANEALATRRELIQTYANLEAQGAITLGEKERLTKEAYDLTRDSISKAADDIEKSIYATQRSSTEIALLTAKVKELRSETKYVDPFFKGLKETFTQSFSSGLDTAFNTVAEAIGGAIAKTKEWKDVFTTVKNAAANLFAQLLKDIASYILKAQAAKLASSLFGGVGSLFGGGSSATGVAAAGATSASASTGIFGLGFLGLKKGGVVGQVPPKGISDPSYWASAPRYRTGTVVGLAPDEQRAILHRGEEVLSADNPRNILNGGGGRAGDVFVRNVLVDDRRRIAEAMNGAHGERVIVQTLLKNGATIRELARG